ncbi:hypothetical protein PEC18_06945 [Paucibacter sp. O1-1]|nr:hypothetical protein [Paucibacter sp. O1-1]MDA3825608.1 hypothetical protein [Paucibacter sp. O1-1]
MLTNFFCIENLTPVTNDDGVVSHRGVACDEAPAVPGLALSIVIALPFNTECGNPPRSVLSGGFWP